MKYVLSVLCALLLTGCLRDQITQIQISDYFNSSSSASLSSASSSSNGPMVIVEHKPGELMWSTYRDGEYDFRIDYPGTVLRKTDNFVRMQNYDSAANMKGLAEGQVFVEIYLARAAEADPTKLSCKKNYPSASQATFGSAQGFRTTGLSGHNTAGTAFVACIEESSGTVHITVVEKDVKGALANKILDSLQFSN